MGQRLITMEEPSRTRGLYWHWRQLADGDYWEVSELEVRVTVAPELA